MNLDPTPTKVLKDHIGSLAHGIGKIINTSFEHGYVCDSLKEEILRPLLKSPQARPSISKFQICLKSGIFR